MFLPASLLLLATIGLRVGVRETSAPGTLGSVLIAAAGWRTGGAHRIISSTASRLFTRVTAGHQGGRRYCNYQFLHSFSVVGFTQCAGIFSALPGFWGRNILFLCDATSAANPLWAMGRFTRI